MIQSAKSKAYRQPPPPPPGGPPGLTTKAAPPVKAPPVLRAATPPAPPVKAPPVLQAAASAPPVEAPPVSTSVAGGWAPTLMAPTMSKSASPVGPRPSSSRSRTPRPSSRSSGSGEVGISYLPTPVPVIDLAKDAPRPPGLSPLEKALLEESDAWYKFIVTYIGWNRLRGLSFIIHSIFTIRLKLIPQHPLSAKDYVMRLSSIFCKFVV